MTAGPGAPGAFANAEEKAKDCAPGSSHLGQVAGFSVEAAAVFLAAINNPAIKKSERSKTGTEPTRENSMVANALRKLERLNEVLSTHFSIDVDIYQD